MIYRLFLLFWLILSLPIWAACSSGETTSEAITSIPTETSIVDSSQASSERSDSVSIIPELREAYIGDNVLVNAVLTVNYPTGWTAQGSGTQLLLASGTPETIDSDANALVVQIMPIEGDMLQDLAELSAKVLVSQAIQDTVGQTVEASEMTINEQTAAYAFAESDSNATFVYAVQIDEDVFVVLTAIKAQTFTDDDQALILAIAESIQYEAGEIPQSQ